MKKNLSEEQIEAKREYYRQYYQRKKREKGITTKPKPEPFKIIRLKTPYIITFD